MSDIKEVRIALEFLKNEKISEIAALKDSTITKTLYDLYFANFDIIEEYINKESKTYLKWEDLEFDNNASVKKHLKVKLGDNIYKAYYHFCFLLNSELFCIENANENLNIYITNKQFFNDLHLERVLE